MTTFADRVYELGGAPAGSILPIGGKVFYVRGTGSDSNSGATPDEAMATVSAAYAKTTSGANDVVVVLSSATAINETSPIVWSKNLTHLVGSGAPNGIAARTRISCGTAGATMSPFITISGYGCIFSNLYIWQGLANAANLINVSVTGNRNYFKDVHFAGGGHATQAVDGGASLLLDGGSENKFVSCTIGVDTVAAAAGMANLLFDNLAARNVFENCRFLLYAGATGAVHVEVVDNAGLDRWNEFKGCSFINTARGFLVASTFVIPAAMTSETNFILLKDCSVVGSTDWDASNRGVIYLNTGTFTGGTSAGLFVVSAT